MSKKEKEMTKEILKGLFEIIEINGWEPQECGIGPDCNTWKKVRFVINDRLRKHKRELERGERQLEMVDKVIERVGAFDFLPPAPSPPLPAYASYAQLLYPELDNLSGTPCEVQPTNGLQIPPVGLLKPFVELQEKQVELFQYQMMTNAEDTESTPLPFMDNDNDTCNELEVTSNPAAASRPPSQTKHLDEPPRQRSSAPEDEKKAHDDNPDEPVSVSVLVPQQEPMSAQVPILIKRTFLGVPNVMAEAEGHCKSDEGFRGDVEMLQEGQRDVGVQVKASLAMQVQGIGHTCSVGQGGNGNSRAVVDSEALDEIRDSLWDQMRAMWTEHELIRQLARLKKDEKEDIEDYVDRVSTLWFRATHRRHAEESGEQRVMFRRQVIRGLPVEVRVELEKVVGLEHLKESVWLAHLRHHQNRYDKKKDAEKIKKDEEAVRRLSQERKEKEKTTKAKRLMVQQETDDKLGNKIDEIEKTMQKVMQEMENRKKLSNMDNIMYNKCFACGKEGHFARSCRKRANKRTGERPKTDGDERFKPRAPMTAVQQKGNWIQRGNHPMTEKYARRPPTTDY